MKTYYIEIEEVLSKTIKVEAESEDDALKQVVDDYNKGKIVLDSDSFVEKNFKVVK